MGSRVCICSGISVSCLKCRIWRLGCEPNGEGAGRTALGAKIKDTKALDALIAGDYKGLIVSESTKGADPVNPPAGGGSVLKSRAEIYAKDEKGRYKMDAIQRQQELAKLEASGKE